MCSNIMPRKPLIEAPLECSVRPLDTETKGVKHGMTCNNGPYLSTLVWICFSPPASLSAFSEQENLLLQKRIFFSPSSGLFEIFFPLAIF